MWVMILHGRRVAGKIEDWSLADIEEVADSNGIVGIVDPTRLWASTETGRWHAQPVCVKLCLVPGSLTNPFCCLRIRKTCFCVVSS
eukprot:4396666-Amphidinium_carterae.1